MRNQLADIITLSIKREINKINTSIPAKIENYDASKRKASVKPQIGFKTKSGESLEYPIINCVPVVFPSTSKASITWPLVKGDSVLLIFSQQSLETWLNSQGKVTETDQRKFSINDAFCIPGLYDFQEVEAGSEDGFQITAGDSFVNIKEDGTIEINGSDDFAVAFNDLKSGFDQLKSDFNSFISTYNGHIHPTPSGPSSPTVSLGTPSTASIDASKVDEVKLP